MKTLVATAFVLMLTIATAHAGLKVVGRGDAMRLDPSGFPADMKASYEIMRVKCVKCHTMERTIIAITTGIAPISGQPFDRNATRAYGIKMMRKPDSNMNKYEVKAVVDLMNYLLVEAGK